MNVKVIIFLGFALASASANVPTTYIHGSLEKLLREARKLLQALQETVQKAIEQSTKNLNKLLEELRSKSLQQQSEESKQIDSAQNKLLLELQQIQKNAQGVDVSSCLKGRREQISNLAKQTEEQLRKCVESLVNSASKTISSSIKSISETTKIVDQISKQIESCGTGPSAIRLLRQIIAQIHKQSTSIPQQISKSERETREAIEKVQNEVQKCVSGKAQSVTSSGSKIIEQVRQCVANLCN